MRWLRRAGVAAVLVVAAGTTLSGATYTASSSNPNNTFGAAADFGVHVTMNDPDAPLRATETLGATATETAGGTITNVEIERSPAGANNWTLACSVSVSPHNCSFNTTTVTSGLYDFRARATSSSGYTRISQVVEDQLIDNVAPSATMNDPGAWFGGTAVPLSTTTVSDNSGGSGVASVRYEYRLSPSGAWTQACVAPSSPYSCDFNALTLTTGTAYDFRAVALDAAGNEGASTPVTDRRADNLAPATATLNAVPSTLSSSVALSGGATDLTSGIAEIRIQYKVWGGSTWSIGCTDSSSPYACTWDTTAVADGWYDVRLLAVDRAGNTLASTVQTFRRVDNTDPAVSLTDPGASLSGTVTLNATASDTGGSGVASVSFQRSPAGADTWTQIFLDTASAWSASWDTGTVVDGSYDLRAVATDNAGNTHTSTIVASRSVNNPPGAADIQTTNGGTAGTVGSGDTLQFIYNEAMNPASIIAGWNGTGGRAVTVRFANNGGNDILTVMSGAATLPLTTGAGVTMGANFVGGGPSPTFNATLTYSGTTFTATIGTTVSGSAVAGGAGTMTWNPSATATNAGGTPVSTTVRTEQGSPADTDF